MKPNIPSILILCVALASCKNVSSGPDVPEEKVYEALAGVNKLYLGSFGEREGADLVKEKIRIRLFKSKRFTVSEDPKQADAILTGSAGVTAEYSSSFGVYGGGGNTNYYATVVLRLVRVKDPETIWLFEYSNGRLRGSVSSDAADKTVDKLLRDTKRADDLAKSNNPLPNESKKSR